MEWQERYAQGDKPTDDNVSAFIQSMLWEELNAYVRQTYQTRPVMEYSGCSMQKGWNVKYRKSGKSLCTLYPMQGYFTALVVIGKKEMGEAELLMPLCSAYTRKVFRETEDGFQGKWLMLDVRSETVLQDVKSLISLRVKKQGTSLL